MSAMPNSAPEGDKVPTAAAPHQVTDARVTDSHGAGPRRAGVTGRAPAPAPAPAAPPGAARTWAVLLIACAGQFLVVLDVSVVNVALPSMRADLGLTAQGLQWVLNAYS